MPPLRRLVNELIEVLADLAEDDELALADQEMDRLFDWWHHHHHPPKPTPGPAVRALLTIKGDTTMGSSISVDSTTATLNLTFEDDKGDTTGVPNGPDGQPATVTYGSDNPGVATVEPATGKVTEVGAGTFNATATVTNTDGTPTMEPDGVTPFSPAPVQVTVTPGAPASDVFTVNG